MDLFSSTEGLIFTLGLLVLLFVMFYLPRFLMSRAVTRVIQTMRHLNAVSPEKATTKEQIGVRPFNTWDRMLRFRDYKPHAFQSLVDLKVIISTEDNRYYLSEERLAGTRLDSIRP